MSDEDGCNPTGRSDRVDPREQADVRADGRRRPGPEEQRSAGTVCRHQHAGPARERLEATA